MTKHLTALRRSPLQARGKLRYEQILKAANQVFDEIGYEAATTNRIAAQGRVPVGSIYQFFPDKAAIYLALAERTAERVGELMDRTLDMTLIALPVDKAAQKIIGPLFDLYAKDSAFRRCMQSGSILPEQVKVYEQIVDQISAKLAPLLAFRFQINERKADFVSRVCISIVTCLLGVDLHGQAQLRNEIVRVVSSYLSSYLEPN